ncbi:hypothetical protein PUN28_015448 [Cardiocondyla obscurior]|uniref:Uncharacterized protein n=1 Tax=Cardiocondyla obscurior TaxID=286306 RepID=A0AAW2EWW6_9HYME
MHFAKTLGICYIGELLGIYTRRLCRVTARAAYIILLIVSQKNQQTLVIEDCAVPLAIVYDSRCIEKKKNIVNVDNRHLKTPPSTKYI